MRVYPPVPAESFGNFSPASSESAAAWACALVFAVYTRSATDASAWPSRSATVFGFMPAAILGSCVVPEVMQPEWPPFCVCDVTAGLLSFRARWQFHSPTQPLECLGH